jgi:hypothetical protein
MLHSCTKQPPQQDIPQRGGRRFLNHWGSVLSKSPPKICLFLVVEGRTCVEAPIAQDPGQELELFRKTCGPDILRHLVNYPGMVQVSICTCTGENA